MKIEHVAMHVNELEAARDFFVKYLGGVSNDGYHNKTTGFRSFFISFDDGARLEIMNKPSMENIAKSINRTGYIHIAFSVGSVEEVDHFSSLANRRKLEQFDAVLEVRNADKSIVYLPRHSTNRAVKSLKYQALRAVLIVNLHLTCTLK